MDLALSFQDNAGCLDIWNKITNIRNRSRKLFQSRSTSSSGLISHVLPTTADTNDATTMSEKESTLLETEQPKQPQHKQQQTHEQEQQETNDMLDLKQHDFHLRHNRQDLVQTSDCAGSHAPLQNDGLADLSSVGSNGIITDTSLTEQESNIQHVWGGVSTEASEEHRSLDASISSTDGNPEMSGMNFDIDDHGHEFTQADAVVMAAQFVGNGPIVGNHLVSEEFMESDKILKQLPIHPKLGDIEAIAVVIAGAQVIFVFLSFPQFILLRRCCLTYFYCCLITVFAFLSPKNERLSHLFFFNLTALILSHYSLSFRLPKQNKTTIHWHFWLQ